MLKKIFLAALIACTSALSPDQESALTRLITTRSCPYENLSGKYLIGLNLSGANLEGANLSNAYMHGVNLQNANLKNANLEDANLSYANLQGADLAGAQISDTTRFELCITSNITGDAILIEEVERRAQPGYYSSELED